MLWWCWTLAGAEPLIDTRLRGGITVSASALAEPSEAFQRGPDLVVAAPAEAEVRRAWLVLAAEGEVWARPSGQSARLDGWLLATVATEVASGPISAWELDVEALALAPGRPVALELRGAAGGPRGAALLALVDDPSSAAHRAVRVTLGEAACDGPVAVDLGPAPAEAWGEGALAVAFAGVGDLSLGGEGLGTFDGAEPGGWAVGELGIGANGGFVGLSGDLWGPGSADGRAEDGLWRLSAGGALGAGFSGCGALAFAATSWALDSDADGLPDHADPCTEVDADGDGVASGTHVRETCPTEAPRDCDDGDPAVHPGATELPGDGVDQDCDGDDGCDADGDGHLALVCGGFDCDDAAAGVHPGATELRGDGIDQDCDGDDLCDEDGDGVEATVCGGADCRDDDPNIYAGAPEVAGDGIDQDCDGLDNCDLDDDGFTAPACGGTDCDDADPAVHPEAEEVWYDGVDQDCDGVDDDADGDGVPRADDCDDADPWVGDRADDADCDGEIDGQPPCGCGATPGGGELLNAAMLLALTRSRRRPRAAYAA